MASSTASVRPGELLASEGGGNREDFHGNGNADLAFLSSALAILCFFVAATLFDREPFALYLALYVSGSLTVLLGLIHVIFKEHKTEMILRAMAWSSLTVTVALSIALAVTHYTVVIHWDSMSPEPGAAP